MQDRVPNRMGSELNGGARLAAPSLWWVFLAAFWVRAALALFWFDPSRLYWPDERIYNDIATGLVAGKGFVATSFNSAPLWPMFMALVYKVFGHSFLALRLVEGALGALACVVMALTARRLFDARVAWWSGMVSALYPPLVYLAGVFYIEHFFTVWLVFSIYALVRLGQQPTWGNAALAGLCLGLASLARSLTFVLIPVVPLVVLLAGGVSWRRRIGLTVAVWGVIALTLTPWTVRNWHEFGHFVPVSSGSGLIMWRGNCEFSRGDTSERFLMVQDDFWRTRTKDPGAEERMKQLRARLANLDEVEADRELGREAMRYIRQDPVGFLARYWKRLLTLHCAYTDTIKINVHGHARNRFVASASSYPLLILGFCGLVLQARRWRELRVLYLVWVVITLGLAVLTTCTRYRLSTDPLLAIFAVAAVKAGWRRLADSAPASARLLAVIALGVVLRLGWCYTLPEHGFWGDEKEYQNIAKNLLATGSYSENGTQPTAFRAPGEPFFLAAIYALGDQSMASSRVWQSLLWAVTLWLAYRVAREMGASERAAGWVAAVAAVYPIYVYVPGVLYPTSLFSLMMLLGTWGLMRAYNGGGWRAAVVGGVGLGLGTLTIPYYGLSVLFAPLWLGRRRWREALVATAVAVVLIAPWPLRNWAVFGAPVMGTQQNLNLWYGNNPQATGSSGSNVRILPRELWIRYRATKATDELAAERMLAEDAWHHIRENPGRTAWLWLCKALNFFRLWPETQTRNEHTTLLTKLASALSFGPVLVLGLIGWWRGGVDRRRASLVWIYYGTFVAVAAVTISKDRFRVPLDVYLMIFAAMWVDRWLASRKGAAPPVTGPHRA